MTVPGGTGLGRVFTLGEQLRRDAEVCPYDSEADLPCGWRGLLVFAVDPSLPRSEGETQEIRIPHEPLMPGPVGGLFEVDMSVPASRTSYLKVDLDDPDLLRSRGVAPDEADARFHGQMVYAIASLTYEAFRKALGRQPGWAFVNGKAAEPSRLVLAPFAMENANAFYSRRLGRICFGYARSRTGLRDFPADKAVFTALSSDIITHEVSHAILDGLRPYFTEPTGPDVPAFHEAFADLMAIFQRFEFEAFIRAQIRRGNGDISVGTLLNVVAPEIGYATSEQLGVRRYVAEHGRPADLRARSEQSPVVTLDEAGAGPHKRGAVLAEAVFEAFVCIARSRAVPFIRLATRGREALRDGELSPELLDHLTDITRRVAAQFQRICIRAIDYLPPVDISFGDFLRAMITADATLVSDDPLGYREAIVNAFRRRRIYPETVRTMSEKALIWDRPRRDLPPVRALSLDQLRFDGDPGAVPRREDAEYHATCLGEFISGSRAMMDELGLLEQSRAPGHAVEPFEIASLRPARRSGPDGQIAFDLIAEVVQQQWVPLQDGRSARMRGGATLILDARGHVRYIVRKRLDETGRRERFADYLNGAGRRYWTQGPRVSPGGDIFQQLCMCADAGDEGVGEEAVEAEPATRDAVGKTWVVVRSPPGVPGGHAVLLDGALPLRTEQPARVPPGSTHEYRLARGDGVVFSTRAAAPAGRGSRDPHPIILQEEGR